MKLRLGIRFKRKIPYLFFQIISIRVAINKTEGLYVISKTCVFIAFYFISTLLLIQKKLDMRLKELNRNNLAFDAAKDHGDFNFRFEPVPHGPAPNAPPIPKDFSFKIDSNLSKIVIPSGALNGLTKLVEDTIRQKLNEAADKIKKLSFPFGRIRPKMKFHPNSRGSQSTGFDLNLVNPYDIVNQALKMISNGSAKGLEEIGKKIDSLSRLSYKTNKDSLRRKIREEILKMKEKKLPVNSDDEDDDK